MFEIASLFNCANEAASVFFRCVFVITRIAFRLIIWVLQWALTPPSSQQHNIELKQQQSFSRAVSFRSTESSDNDESQQVTPQPRMRIAAAAAAAALYSPTAASMCSTTPSSTSYHGQLFEFKVRVSVGALSAGENVGTCPLVVEVEKKAFPSEVPAIHDMWCPSKYAFFSALSHASRSPRSGASQGLSFRRYDEEELVAGSESARPHPPQTAESFLLEISSDSRGCGKSTVIRSLACCLEAHVLRVDVASWLELMQLLDDKTQVEQAFESAWLQMGVVLESKARQTIENDECDKTPVAVNERYMVVLELPPGWVSCVDEIAHVISFVLDRGESGVPVIVLDKGFEPQPLLTLIGDESDEQLTAQVHCEMCDKKAVKQIVAIRYGCDVFSWDFKAPDQGPLIHPAKLIELINKSEPDKLNLLIPALEDLVQQEALCAK